MNTGPPSRLATDTPYVYEGSELETFRHAVRWKAYVRAQVQPYLGSRVLEVGAGLGTTTAALASGFEGEWTCLEPDAGLARELRARQAQSLVPVRCEVIVGALAQLSGVQLYDSILYVDVLEHIERDTEEVSQAAGHLTPGGHLIVLAPAHQWLFTPFDAAIGHHRRYDRASLSRLGAPGLRLTKLMYLDSVGLLASAANRFLLRSDRPTVRQVVFWDRCMVPLSRVLDPLLRFTLGKSILAIWQAGRR